MATQNYHNQNHFGTIIAVTLYVATVSTCSVATYVATRTLYKWYVYIHIWLISYTASGGQQQAINIVIVAGNLKS